MYFTRQVRGELRKLFHPLVAVAVLAAMSAVCLVQAANLTENYPGPSLVDATGCAEISALQFATFIGFALAGVFAGLATAEDVSSGTIAAMSLREPRGIRIVFVKYVAVLIALTVSSALCFGALIGTQRIVRARGTDIPEAGRTSTLAAVSVVAHCFVVAAFAAAFATCIALVIRSAISTIVVVVAVYTLPLTLLNLPLMWVTPTRWVVEWLHLDPFGEGIDYIGDNSTYTHRGFAAALSGGLLIFATIGSLVIATSLIQWSVRTSTRHG